MGEKKRTCPYCGELTTKVYYDPVKGEYYHLACLFQFNSNQTRVDAIEERDRLTKEYEDRLAQLQQQIRERDEEEHRRWQEDNFRTRRPSADEDNSEVEDEFSREGYDFDSITGAYYLKPDYRDPVTGHRYASSDELKRYEAMLAAWHKIKDAETELNAYCKPKEPEKKKDDNELGRSITFED